ncbi:MAG: hypothetical protein AAGG38_06375 [Planctomycetota bacterium]
MPEPNRLRRGDAPQFPAEEWNRIRRAASDYYTGLGRSGGGAIQQDMTPDVVPVRNDTGEPLDRLTIVGLDGPVFEPDPDDPRGERGFLETIAFRGVKPTAEHFGRIAILLDPADAGLPAAGDEPSEGRFSRGLVSGLIQVKLKLIDEKHQWCDPPHEETAYLESRPQGAAEIVYREPDEHEDDDGLRWALVRLTPPEPWVRQIASQWASQIGNLVADYRGIPPEQRADQTIPVSQLHFHDDAQAPIAWNNVQAAAFRNAYLGERMPIPLTASEGYNQHGHTSQFDGGFISGMGPHDHRDNFNGGYAWAVYHPGTSVPQMPWAI